MPDVPAAHTPGATRAGPGAYLVNLGTVAEIMSGPPTPPRTVPRGGAGRGAVLDVPANTRHEGYATSETDVVFFTVTDAAHNPHGVKA